MWLTSPSGIENSFKKYFLGKSRLNWWGNIRRVSKCLLLGLICQWFIHQRVALLGDLSTQLTNGLINQDPTPYWVIWRWGPVVGGRGSMLLRVASCLLGLLLPFPPFLSHVLLNTLRWSSPSIPPWQQSSSQKSADFGLQALKPSANITLSSVKMASSVTLWHARKLTAQEGINLPFCSEGDGKSHWLPVRPIDYISEEF